MSLFSKRHYVWLASAARDLQRRSWSYDADGLADPTMVVDLDAAIETLADALERENPGGFNRDRFLRAVFGPFNTQDGDEKCPTQSPANS